jgi:hypothetical protein
MHGSSAEHLPNKHKALRSNSSIVKKKKKKKDLQHNDTKMVKK